MARYREKSPEDLAWNYTRRQITRDLDTQLQNFREELLNELLSYGWEQHVKALETGTVLQLEDQASTWVKDILAKQLRPRLEAQVDGVARS